MPHAPRNPERKPREKNVMKTFKLKRIVAKGKESKAAREGERFFSWLSQSQTMKASSKRKTENDASAVRRPIRGRLEIECEL